MKQFFRRRTEGGFSDNPFMIGYDNQIYEPDSEIGFRFPKGKLITDSGFDSLEKQVEQGKGKDILLNLGDSSTSGWNGNRVFSGNRNQNAPFFTYKTYPQLIGEQTDLLSLNAGVPGYTSYQGVKYAKRLLKRLAALKRVPRYISIYFGNNDSTFNRIEDKTRLDGKRASHNPEGYRVTSEDFRKNLMVMVELARDYGSQPVFIAPLVHLDWEPGIRAGSHREEFQEALCKSDENVRKDLEKAREYYKRGEFAQALELDRVLPRIKQAYREIITEVAKQTDIPLVDVQDRVPLTANAEYFVDYCHPSEMSNHLIADEMLRLIGVRKGKTIRQKIDVPLKFRIMDGFVRLTDRFTSKKVTDHSKELYIYPFY
jgi:lysophospholipase L1-like esterase